MNTEGREPIGGFHVARHEVHSHQVCAAPLSLCLTYSQIELELEVPLICYYL